jgi:itaconyl-CoA hydratase
MRQIGPKHYRSEIGLYFEDLEEGALYEHRPGRTITESDNINFSLMTMNQHPAHCDRVYAETTEFGQPLVNSGLTIAIVLGMTVADISGKAVANLEMTDIKLVKPVHPGDTIYAESLVVAKRESKSRPNAGIVTVRTTGRKANGEVFLSFERSVLIQKREGSKDHLANY